MFHTPNLSPQPAIGDRPATPGEHLTPILFPRSHWRYLRGTFRAHFVPRRLVGDRAGNV